RGTSPTTQDLQKVPHHRLALPPGQVDLAAVEGGDPQPGGRLTPAGRDQALGGVPGGLGVGGRRRGGRAGRGGGGRRGGGLAGGGGAGAAGGGRAGRGGGGRRGGGRAGGGVAGAAGGGQDEGGQHGKEGETVAHGPDPTRCGYHARPRGNRRAGRRPPTCAPGHPSS